ncbi:MAG: hypothetical protein HKN23_21875 [Verrucomicrobiales bacterium]|nr:hypothetical protein [Verrucomicrobiales bacterium]
MRNKLNHKQTAVKALHHNRPATSVSLKHPLQMSIQAISIDNPVHQASRSRQEVRAILARVTRSQ